MKKKQIEMVSPSNEKEFTHEVERAHNDGMCAIDPDGNIIFDVSNISTCRDIASKPIDDMLSGMETAEADKIKSYDENGHPILNQQSVFGGSCGGLLITGNASVLDWSQHSYVPVHGCGTDHLGYVVWGYGNTWPGQVFRSAANLPVVASIIDYMERTLFGLGPQVMYCITRYSGGTVTHEEVPYKDAEVYLKERVAQILGKLEAYDDDEPKDAVSDTIRKAEGFIAEGSPQKSKSYRQRMIEHYEMELHEAEAELDKYRKDVEFLDSFLERNNLSYFYKRWNADVVRLGICWPMVGLERGRADRWEVDENGGKTRKPRIVDIDIRESDVMRFEQPNVNNGMKIEHVYYSERFRTDPNGLMAAGDIVAYPSIMPDHAFTDLRNNVTANAKKPISERECWFCCPNYHPTPTKPVYPQMPWWSIFPSQVYQYACTLIYDKNSARRNSTMWGKILFINTAYLSMIFNQAGEKGKTPEGQQEIRNAIYGSVENFLRNRDNNGKLLLMDSYPSADESKMMDSIRIVDVPRNADYKASEKELSEIYSLISMSCGVQMPLIGSSPVSKEITGTAQRTMHLLKNGQLAPDRITFTDFFNKFIFRYNELSHKFKMVVNYPTLTTLDNSKTGTIDMHDGK